MQISVIMKYLQSRNHLGPKMENGLETKSLLTKVKQLLSIWPQERKHNTVEVALNAFPVNLRKADYS